MMHPIYYIVLLGKRGQNPFPFLPSSEEMVHPSLIQIGRMPQTMEHLVVGSDYYQACLNTGRQGGYKVIFVFEDSIEDFDIHRLCGTNYPNPVCVFLFCTEDKELLEHIFVVLERIHEDSFVYLMRQELCDTGKLRNSFSTIESVIDFLMRIAPNYLVVDDTRMPYSVPILTRSIDTGYCFYPTRVNTFMAQSALGNWGFKFTPFSEDELRGKQIEAMAKAETFERQNIVVHQIRLMESLEKESNIFNEDPSFLKDQVNAPLVMSIPFTGSDARKVLYNKTQPELEHVRKNFGVVML